MWARWLAGTRREVDASKRRSGRKGGGRGGGGRGECDGLPPEQGFVAGWQGGGGGMQGGADAQLSRRSMQLHANPSNGRRLHSLPLYFSLSRISLSLSFFIPLCTLLFSSSCSFLASLPTFGCFSLSRSLPLSPPPCPHSSCYPSILTAPSVNDLRAR